MNDRLYFGKDDHIFYCVSLEGKLIWKFPIQDIICAWPAAYWNDKVYFGSFNNTLYCLNAVTGAIVWTYKGTAPIMAPLSWHGLIIVGSYDYRMYCLDAETGKVVWTFKTQGLAGGGEQAVMDDVLYTASYDNNVYALNMETGKELWRFKTNGFVTQVGACDGRIFFGSWDCNFYCLNLEGKLLWKFQTSMGSPSKVAPPESTREITAEFTLPAESEKPEQDRYKQEMVVDTSGPQSDYVIKSDYVTEHKYTKSRKIKSMSSGWDD